MQQSDGKHNRFVVVIVQGEGVVEIEQDLEVDHHHRPGDSGPPPLAERSRGNLYRLRFRFSGGGLA